MNNIIYNISNNRPTVGQIVFIIILFSVVSALFVFLGKYIWNYVIIRLFSLTNKAGFWDMFLLYIFIVISKI